MARTSPSWRAWLAGAALSALALDASAVADTGVRKGPWLMEPRSDSITVMLERTTPGPITIRAEPVSTDPAAAARDAVTLDDATAGTLHEARLVGLRPGTRYHYVVSGPGFEPTGGTFATPTVAPVPFRFVVYGDTRSNATVHARMVRAIRGEGADFVIHTGDLVGDGRREDSWQTFFSIERDLLRDTPLVPVIGNHEIIRPSSSGIDHFRRYMHCEPNSPDPELDYTFGYGNVRLLVANAFDDWTSPTRRAWLDAQLARARAEVPTGFVLVAMHWGMCSCGPHGENHAMRAAGIDDVLRAHHVDLVISGHDHIYERGDDNGLRYIVTGGGGAPLYSARHERRYTLAYAAEHHFVRADVESDRIEFSAVRADGSVLERCALRHSGWDCPASPGAMASVESAGVTAALVGATAVGELRRGCSIEPDAVARRGAGLLLALMALAGLAWSALRRRMRR